MQRLANNADHFHSIPIPISAVITVTAESAEEPRVGAGCLAIGSIASVIPAQESEPSFPHRHRIRHSSAGIGTVIPAQAGIQGIYPAHWIPAYAGMTNWWWINGLSMAFFGFCGGCECIYCRQNNALRDANPHRSQYSSRFQGIP